MLSLFELAALLLSLSALFGFLNRTLLHLPNSVGLLLLGLIASLVLVAADFLFPGVRLYDQIGQSLRQLDFTQIVFNGMLAFLLFAGALNVDVDALRRRAVAVSYLAVAGTLISTALVGLLFYFITSWLGLAVPLPWAFVFGALISPTDPVAVLSMLKDVPIPERLRVEAEGEALLNDGVGVVLFTLLISFAVGAEDINVGTIAWDFVREAGGGIAIGLVAGYIAYRAMRAIDDFPIEVLITLALVTGSYALAQRVGASGPLATVAAGLLVGHRAPQDAMSEQTEKYVSALWTLIDEVLNAMLFLLIGLEVFVLEPTLASLLVALAAIPIALFARWVAVAAPLLVPLKQRVNPRYVPFLTWAAVRGGISVALALALPQVAAKPIILAATYGVVLFSILVQGPTLAPLARRLKLQS